MGTSDPLGTPKSACPAFTSARPGRAFPAPPPPPPWQRVPWPPASGRGRTRRAELPPTAARGPPARHAGKEEPCMGLRQGASVWQGPGRKLHIWRGAGRGRRARPERGARTRWRPLPPPQGGAAPRRAAPPPPRAGPTTPHPTLPVPGGTHSAQHGSLGVGATGSGDGRRGPGRL